MVSVITILLRAIQSGDGNFLIKLNVPKEEKIKYSDVSNVLGEVIMFGGEIISSTFTYDNTIGHKTNVFLAFVSIPVTPENLQKIQTWTFKQIKFD